MNLKKQPPRGQVAGIDLDGGVVASYEYNPVGATTAKAYDPLLVGTSGEDCRRQPAGRDERERASQLLVKITASGPAYYHHDGLGSTVALTGENGELLESYRYDAFGAASVFDASGSALPASPHGNRFLFTGREWLAEVGLYDYRNRVYSAQIGRFLQTDPIRFSAGDVNIYRYVGNNSVNLIDPLGLRWFGGGDDGEWSVGRPDTIIEPGEGNLGGWLEQNVPAMETMSIYHDALVDFLTNHRVPDWLANIPTMPACMGAALLTETWNSCNDDNNTEPDC